MSDLIKEGKQELSIRVGGEPIDKISIGADNPYTFKYNSSIFNITEIEMFFSETDKLNGEVKIEIFEEEYNSLVGEAIFEDLEDGWNKAIFPSTDGIFETPLKIKISIRNGDGTKVYLGKDKNNDIPMKLYYVEYEREISLRLDEYVKSIRKIYRHEK